MNETIFHLDNDGNLFELNESTYISEAQLQQLLADFPNLISGSQINHLRPRRWLLISREFGVPDDENVQNRWSLDHLFIDQDGIPTLVEVKRSTDTRIRREVVGQILDYAANAVIYWKIEEIIQKFETNCNAREEEHQLVMDNFLQGEMDVETFWNVTQINLKAGKIRMLIIADIIPNELRRIIEFLNEQMSPAEILGVEIKQFSGKDNNIRTLVPRVVGQTAAAESMKSVKRGQQTNWTEASFFTDLFEKRGKKELETALKLFEWLKTKVTRFWYGSGKIASMVPVYNHLGTEHFLFALWSNGTIEVYFQWYKPPFDNESKKMELLEQINQINGINISTNKISGRPGIPLHVLENPTDFQKFTNAFQWYLDEIQQHK